MATINMDVSLQESVGISLDLANTINIEFGQNVKIDSTIAPSEKKVEIALKYEDPIDIDFGIDETTYTGKYETVSSIDEQVLNTANKKMMKDVVIKPIPVSRVPSPHNKGYTVTIG